MSEITVMRSGKQRTVTVIDTGETFTFDDDHERFEQLVEACKENDIQKLKENIDYQESINRVFEETGLSVEDGVAYYKDEEIDGALADRIVELVQDPNPEEGVENYVRFFERLQDNPSYRAVEQLYEFLNTRGIPIAKDGRFVAYKRVTPDLRDIYGRKHNRSDEERFDNSPGSVVTMSRNEVNDDPTANCAAGLHVGNYDYAGPDGWYGRGSDPVVLVKVCPSDVVAVPKDHDCGKVRCCRYEVVTVMDGDEKLSDTTTKRKELD